MAARGHPARCRPGRRNDHAKHLFPVRGSCLRSRHHRGVLDDLADARPAAAAVESSGLASWPAWLLRLGSPLRRRCSACRHRGSACRRRWSARRLCTAAGLSRPGLIRPHWNGLHWPRTLADARRLHAALAVGAASASRRGNKSPAGACRKPVVLASASTVQVRKPRCATDGLPSWREPAHTYPGPEAAIFTSAHRQAWAIRDGGFSAGEPDNGLPALRASRRMAGASEPPHPPLSGPTARGQFGHANTDLLACRSCDRGKIATFGNAIEEKLHATPRSCGMT